MIDRGLLGEILTKTLSRGGEYADIFVETRSMTSLVVDDGKLEKVVTGTESGAGVRLLHQGKTAYAFSNDLTRTALSQAAFQTSKMGSHASKVNGVNLETRTPSVDFHVLSQPGIVPVGRKIDLIRTADSIARNTDRRVKQVSVIYRDAVQKVQIANSDGYVAEDERIYLFFVVQVIAVQDDIVQTGYESIGGFIGFELFEKNPVEELACKAASRAVMMLTAQKAPAGRMPVVISSSAGGTMIHEAIGHGLEADLVQQGLSVFSNKLGSRVASELVTVIDDATLHGKRGSFRFDDEGTPSRKTVLVEKGVLKNYLYDRLAAMKDDTVSTGNGRRESYRNRPIPRMTNTYIAPGETPPGQIIESLESGLFVEKMGGGQVNTVTGDFVFEVQEGYIIEKGGKAEPVRGATLTGNGPEILKSIDMVGSDLGFSIGTCGKDSQGVPVTDGMPTIRVSEIVVGGAYQ